MSASRNSSVQGLDFSPLQFAITMQDLCNLFAQSPKTKNYGSLEELANIGGKNQLLQKLNVTLNDGLPLISKLDHNSRISAFGTNEFPKPKMKGCFHFVKEQFNQFCIQVLFVCSVLVFCIGFLKTESRRMETFSEAGILLLAVLFVVIIGSVTDYKKEKQFQELLANQFTPTCVVFRSGNTVQIPVTQLLVGDILVLKEGDHVFADCLFLQGSFLMIDQSSLTGETELVQKTPAEEQQQQIEFFKIIKLIQFISLNGSNKSGNESDPFILTGCNIIEGSAYVLVCSVGINTQIGSLRKQIDSQEFFQSLILAEDVDNLAKLLIIIGAILAAVMFLILFLYLILHLIEYDEQFLQESTMLILVKIFMESFLVLVLSVPEGLPMIFTLSLAFAVHQIKLNACDVMGGCTDLVFDKTGTLSKGKLTVNKIFLYNQTLDKLQSTEFKLIFSEFAEFIALSCQQSIEQFDIQEGQRDSIRALNSNIIQTMIKFLSQQSYNLNQIVEKYEGNIIKIIPQHHKREFSAVILKLADSYYRCIFKGSPEFIIKNSKYIRIGTQSIQLSALSEEHQHFLLTEILENFSEQCIKTIAFSYYDFTNENMQIEEMFGEFTLLGLLGIHEEYRENLTELFQTLLNDIKIQPRIITGDQHLISQKLLNCCKLLTNPQIIKTKQKLILSGQQFVEKIQTSPVICNDILLIYRATPAEKALLVKSLINQGRIVGYIGDGINDAEALKAADISISMGQNAAQIAQENSQVILQDNNLENLIVMLQWGRNIYENIQRFIWYQLTFCVVSIFYMLYSSMTVGESPFSVIQIIWLSLIHDVFSSIALATESPSKNVFKNPTFKRKEYIISGYILTMILLQIVYQLTVLITLHTIFMATKNQKTEWTAIEKWKEREHIPNTILFACLGWLQITSLICSRRIQINEYNIFSGIQNNLSFVFIIGFVIAAQLSILFFGGRFFEVAELSISSHVMCLVLGFGSYVWFIFSKQCIIFGKFVIQNQKEIEENELESQEESQGQNEFSEEDEQLISQNN